VNCLNQRFNNNSY